VPDPQPSWSSLEPAAVSAAAGEGWTVRLLPSAGSTNAVAAEQPVARTLVVADHQTAGRGRLDREWETPPGTALTFSAVVDPRLPDAHWPLLPLATAVAVAEGVRRSTGLEPALKWPNDLLLDDLKVAGILLERVPDPADPDRPLAVIGIGINVALAAEDLPVPTATSLAIAGSAVDRAAVFAAVLPALTEVLAALRADPAAVLERYRDACDTLGRDVVVALPDGGTLTGTATGLDHNGRLLVGEQAVGAGDVVHVRPA
jgi:BirA family biotin operon repressor/biotin-[acetyl-CoA-carboxylase] ligase